MTDETLQAILARIIIEPDADVHRLVFADALDERGEPGDAERAKFIRAAIERRGEKLKCCVSPVGYDVGFDPRPIPPCVTHRDPDTFLNVICDYDRGFVDELTLSAADFLRHADTLLWNPDRDVKCPNCDGRGETRFCDAAGDMDDEPCRQCGGSLAGDYKRGSGRVTRPLPPLTAQPIRKVTLTTIPSPSDARMRQMSREYRIDWYWHPTEISGMLGNAVVTATRENATKILEREWPGVEFVLPTQHVYVADYADIASGAITVNELCAATGSPAVPELPPQIPLTGWTCERLPRQGLPVELRYQVTGGAWESGDVWGMTNGVDPGLRLSLRCEQDRPAVPPGFVFGPVQARDREGRLWECQAILTHAMLDFVGDDDFMLNYEAQSTGPVTLVT